MDDSILGQPCAANDVAATDYYGDLSAEFAGRRNLGRDQLEFLGVDSQLPHRRQTLAADFENESLRNFGSGHVFIPSTIARAVKA